MRASGDWNGGGSLEKKAKIIEKNQLKGVGNRMIENDWTRRMGARGRKRLVDYIDKTVL